MGMLRAICVAAAVLAAAPAHAQVGESVAATVNDELITTYEVRQRAKMLLTFAETQPTPDIMKQAEDQALRGLIDEKLQIQEAKALERAANAEGQLVPTDDSVTGALENMARQSGTDLDTNLAELRAAGVDEQTLRDQVRAELAWQRLIGSRFSDGIRIGSELVDEAMAELVSSLQEPQYRVAEIFLEINSVADEPRVREEMNSIVQQLQASGRFVELARQYSESPSASRGGDLGFQPLSAFPPEIAAVLPSLPPENVATPIRAAGGLYLIALIEKRDAASAEQLTLKAVVLPQDQSASEAEKAEARAQLDAAARRAQGCEAAEEIAGRVEGAFVSDLGTLASSSLQPQVRAALSGVEPGQVSPAISSQLGAQLFVLCDRSIGGPGIPTREQVAQQMEDQRRSMLSRRYLRDLHREALIDVRGDYNP